MSFKKRRIDVTITLGTGAFGETIGSTVTLTGHRVVAQMQTYGGDAKGEIMLTLYGLPLSMINQLTTIGPVMNSVRGKNLVQVAAGDDGAALSTLFIGSIFQAWADFSAMPEAVLVIHGVSGLVADLKPVNATSYKGAADVPTIMADLAKQMGLTLENNGVKAVLHDPYFPGTAYQQMRACARAADIEAIIDRDKLAIWPKDGHRTGNVPVISPANGLKGYPTFSSQGIGVECLYHPDIQMGGQINLQSSLIVASGVWNVYSVAHHLEAEKPGGKWDTYLTCFRAPT